MRVNRRHAPKGKWAPLMASMSTFGLQGLLTSGGHLSSRISPVNVTDGATPSTTSAAPHTTAAPAPATPSTFVLAALSVTVAVIILLIALTLKARRRRRPPRRAVHSPVSYYVGSY